MFLLCVETGGSRTMFEIQGGGNATKRVLFQDEFAHFCGGMGFYTMSGSCGIDSRAHSGRGESIVH